MKKLTLIFMALVSLVAFYVSCTKQHDTASSILSPESYIDTYHEADVMSSSQLTEFMKVCDLFPREVLEKMLCTPQDTSKEACNARVKELMSYIRGAKANSEQLVETIIQVGNKRIIDANQLGVAVTIAHIGMSTNGTLISYDYYKSSQNKINSTDVYLAGWALSTTNQPGPQFVAQDNYIEFSDPIPLMEFSGGNWEVETALTYNGPTIPHYVYWNVFINDTASFELTPGTVLLFGADSEFGSLILDLTLQDETIPSSTYNSAYLTGAIPGTTTTQIALFGGPWPQ